MLMSSLKVSFFSLSCRSNVSARPSDHARLLQQIQWLNRWVNRIYIMMCIGLYGMSHHRRRCCRQHLL